MKVQVLRGVPGCGKSRYAKSLHNARVVSADQFFEGPDGSYNFDPAKIGAAHSDCLRRYLALLNIINPHAMPELLVVDNTNASIAEMAPYVALAAAHGFEVEIVEFVCDPAVAAARNVHGVPAEIVQKIHDIARANDPLIPPWWKRTVL